MRRPQHMTMQELIALPVLHDSERSALSSIPTYATDQVYGGAFEDHQGYAWGTILRGSRWMRYPLRRPTARRPMIAPLMSMFSTRRALLRVPV